MTLLILPVHPLPHLPPNIQFCSLPASALFQRLQFNRPRGCSLEPWTVLHSLGQYLEPWTYYIKLVGTTEMVWVPIATPTPPFPVYPWIFGLLLLRNAVVWTSVELLKLGQGDSAFHVVSWINLIKKNIQWLMNNHSAVRPKLGQGPGNVKLVFCDDIPQACCDSKDYLVTVLHTPMVHVLGR